MQRWPRARGTRYSRSGTDSVDDEDTEADNSATNCQRRANPISNFIYEDVRKCLTANDLMLNSAHAHVANLTSINLTVIYDDEVSPSTTAETIGARPRSGLASAYFYGAYPASLMVSLLARCEWNRPFHRLRASLRINIPLKPNSITLAGSEPAPN